MARRVPNRAGPAIDLIRLEGVRFPPFVINKTSLERRSEFREMNRRSSKDGGLQPKSMIAFLLRACDSAIYLTRTVDRHNGAEAEVNTTGKWLAACLGERGEYEARSSFGDKNIAEKLAMGWARHDSWATRRRYTFTVAN